MKSYLTELQYFSGECEWTPKFLGKNDRTISSRNLCLLAMSDFGHWNPNCNDHRDPASIRYISFVQPKFPPVLHPCHRIQSTSSNGNDREIIVDLRFWSALAFIMIWCMKLNVYKIKCKKCHDCLWFSSCSRIGHHLWFLKACLFSTMNVSIILRWMLSILNIFEREYKQLAFLS